MTAIAAQQHHATPGPPERPRMPLKPAATNPRFWDKIARKYAAKPIADMAAYEKTLERTRAYLSKDQSVLEIGCGTGSTAILHAPHVRHITGADIAPEMIAIANEKLAAGGPANADFIAATLDDERFRPESYDVVLAFSFLHLVDDLPAALARIREILKPGGQLITKTPCIGDMGFVPRLLVPAIRGRIPARDMIAASRTPIAEKQSKHGSFQSLAQP